MGNECAPAATQENISGFVSSVIENFYEDSHASISLEIERARENAVLALKKGKYLRKAAWDTSLEHFQQDEDNLSQAEADLLDLIIEGQIHDEQAHLLSFPKDRTLKVRLRNAAYDLLYPDYSDDDWPEKQFYSSRASYIRALLEDYSRHSYYQREGIFYRAVLDRLNTILSSGDKRKILQIGYVTASGQSQLLDFKPYCLSNESQANFHYLIGLARQRKPVSSEYRTAVLRISRINSLKERSTSAGSGKITKEQGLSIEKEIANKGVSFLIGENDQFKIWLSPVGRQHFQNIAHLRPLPIKMNELNDGAAIYSFDCTPLQIQYYFFQFGEDAVVLSPMELHQRMCEKYEKACQNYGKLKGLEQL